MHQIFYASTVTKNFDLKRDIPEILAKSEKNNGKDNISGILLYKSGIFLQLLEGDEAAVEKVYTRIAQDPRHENIVRMFSLNCNERIFPSWKMAYKELSQELDIKMINDVLNWNTLFSKSRVINNQQILKMLSQFRERIDNKILTDTEV
jgi:hypothetical protein